MSGAPGWEARREEEEGPCAARLRSCRRQTGATLGHRGGHREVNGLGLLQGWPVRLHGGDHGRGIVCLGSQYQGRMGGHVGKG